MNDDSRALRARFMAHRTAMEERLKQEPDDDELRDMLEDVVEAIETLELDGEMEPTGDLIDLETAVAEKLQS